VIAKLSGTVDSILDDSVIIDVNGVGYQVFISSKLKDSLVLGATLSVKIFHIFKQETQYLCGFEDEQEMNVFKALLGVHGIGVKSAMSVLSTLSIEEFAMAVASQDSTALNRTNGIGKKTAERILLELKDKVLTNMKDIKLPNNENVNDAVLGLVSLGYQKHKVLKAMTKTLQTLGSQASINELIVNCLKEIN
jgi:Holliday junction DNA helicase RuvA